jgi:hypothetical protein
LLGGMAPAGVGFEDLVLVIVVVVVVVVAMVDSLCCRPLTRGPVEWL